MRIDAGYAPSQFYPAAKTETRGSTLATSFNYCTMCNPQRWIGWEVVIGGERWRERGGGRKCNKKQEESGMCGYWASETRSTTVGDQRTLHTISMCIYVYLCTFTYAILALFAGVLSCVMVYLCLVKGSQVALCTNVCCDIEWKGLCHNVNQA